MMTKAEERKALEKIKKILEECGADSYIGMAFNGCVEMAESNIDNDFANDPKECIKNITKKYDAANKEIEEWKKAYEVNAELRCREKELHKAEVEALNGRINELRVENAKLANDWNEERRDVTVATEGGEKQVKPFAKVQFINHEGFRFVNIVEKSGWTNSYKIDELTELTIQ